MDITSPENLEGILETEGCSAKVAAAYDGILKDSSAVLPKNTEGGDVSSTDVVPPKRRPARTYGRKSAEDTRKTDGEGSGDTSNAMDSGLMQLLDLPIPMEGIEETYGKAVEGVMNSLIHQDGGSEEDDDETRTFPARIQSSDAGVLPEHTDHRAPSSTSSPPTAMLNDDGQTDDTDDNEPDIRSFRPRGRIGAMRKRIEASDNVVQNGDDVSPKSITANKLQMLAEKMRARNNPSDSAAADVNDSRTEDRPANDVIDSLFEDDSDNELPNVSEGIMQRNSSRNQSPEADQESDSDVLYDSDGNALYEEPPKSSSKRRSKHGKDQSSEEQLLELRKETERLLRSTIVDLPQRQSKLTIGNFLAARGISRSGTMGTKTSNFETTPSNHDVDANSVPEESQSHEPPLQESPSQENPPPPAAIQSAPEEHLPEESHLPLPLPKSRNPNLPLPLKVDKIISKSNLRSIEENNRAIARRLVLKADLNDDDEGEEEDFLEVIQVKQNEGEPESTASHKVPFAQPMRMSSRALLNQQLIQRNVQQAKKRREEEEEQRRLALEEREKQKAKRKEERRAAWLAEKAEREGKTDQIEEGQGDINAEDDDVAVLVAGTEEDANHRSKGEDMRDRTNENDVETSDRRPAARRLFSGDDARRPFTELFRDRAASDLSEAEARRDETGVHDGDEDRADTADSQAFLLNAMRDNRQEVQSQDINHKVHLNYSYSFDTASQELLNTQDTQAVPVDESETDPPRPPAVVVPAPSPAAPKRVGRMKGKEGKPKAGSLMYFFEKAKQQPASLTLTDENDDMDATCPAGAGELRAIGGLVGARDALDENSGLLDMLSGQFDDEHVRNSQQEAGSGMDENDDVFAALLRDSSDEEDSVGVEHKKVAARMVDESDSDDSEQNPSDAREEDQENHNGEHSTPTSFSQLLHTSDPLDDSLQSMRDPPDIVSNRAESSTTIILGAERQKEKSVYVDAEAEEEEDEFFGLGGADGDEVGEALDQDDKDLVVSDEEISQGFQEILDLHRQQVQEEHEKEITELLNDVTTGNLRKRKARRSENGGFLDDSDEDDELLLARIRARGFIEERESLGDEARGLEMYAANPETAAFARCFQSTCAVKEGFLSSDEDPEPEGKAPAVGLTRKVHRVRTRDKRDRGGEDSDEEDMDAAVTTGAKRARLERYRTWPLTDEADDVEEGQSGVRRELFGAELSISSEKPMQFEEERIDVLAQMMERKRARAMTKLSRQALRARSPGRVEMISRTTESSRIFMKLSAKGGSTTGSGAAGSTSPSRKKRSVSSMSGFNDGGTADVSGRRGGMGFRVGVEKNIEEAPVTKSKGKKKRGDMKEGASNQRLLGLFSRERSFRT
ncbi:uncharacterized protein SPPG_04577 [Spizellomyces punctatus DAOM BR117]|uniref:DNA replication checkpoint mediator MRC1 domain-containing protein n=1 Tax=Spizellomyces punctatus (strain DAOM BR117) TaxID=645134 RepID=A0A0L0HFJ4_SPIPD|nr:uncharacterized protein SPPG_04577 [Spizellomyces punctatus DAOM BR117]KND00246.1 hypothetical protein SPPG_04577 [Spizellomyces punctatus DAOM BR117]|eukprot:XP_016608285.1 hypothetical protein SPPG_04577 [Spizellomyces punctatus DAOM BR117]